MKYALVHGKKSEASKGANGICPNCGAVLIAKCGTQRINHWAHKGIRSCDLWWEPETEWHRSWKNEFPSDWQEKSQIDVKTGEKHIADIITDQNFVIEFQHSYIRPEERVAREAFYGNMTWVVDGTRNKLEFQKFSKGMDYSIKIERGLYKVFDPEDFLPASWLGSRVPVVFDFLASHKTTQSISSKNVLYCLFPIVIGNHWVIAEFSRKLFIQSIMNGQWAERTSIFMNQMELIKKEHQENSKRLESQKANTAFQNLMEFKRVRRRRF